MGHRDYSDNIDINFVIQLAKVGEVHLLSSQVTERGKSLDMSNVTIPAGVTLKWAGRSDERDGCTLTFRFPD